MKWGSPLSGKDVNQRLSLRGRGLLLAILLVGALLRFLGLDYGLPFQLHADEIFYRATVSRMVAEANADPEFYHYPGLPFYGLIAAARVGHAYESARADESREFADYCRDDAAMTRVQRRCSALLALATILLLYFLAGGGRVGLWAAAITALLPLHVRNAHFGVLDVPATFFVALALLAIHRAQRRSSWMPWVLAGACVGLATAMRYSPLILLIPLACALVLRRRDESKRLLGVLWDRRLWLSVLSSALAFLATSPYTLLSYAEFREAWEERVQRSLGSGGSLSQRLDVFVDVGLGQGFGWLVCALAFLGLARLRRRRELLPLLAWGVVYALVLASGREAFVRYLLPLLPVFVVFAAEGAMLVVRAASRRIVIQRLAFATLLAALLLSCGWTSLRITQIFMRPTSFEELETWLDEHEPEGQRIAFASRSVARMLKRFKPNFAAQEMLYGDEPSYLVLLDYPDAGFEAHDGAQRILDAAAGRELVFEVDAHDPLPEARGGYGFWVPIRNVLSFRRLGPRVSIYRIKPGPRPAEAPPAPGEVRAFRALPMLRSLICIWQPPVGDELPLSYSLSFATMEQVQRQEIEATIHLPGSARQHRIFPLPAGNYWTAIRAVGLGGEGPPAVSGPVTVR